MKVTRDVSIMYEQLVTHTI